MASRILVVDDELSLREFLEIFLKKEGYEVQTAKDGKEGWDLIEKKSFDMVISDLKMPKMSGIELLTQAKERNKDLLFIMMTAFGTTETAVEAMKLGAYDYILKPFKLDEVRIILKQALRSQSLETENRLLKKELSEKNAFHHLIGDSKAMHQVFDLIQKAAQNPVNVLITGESGTGKEMIAKAIHYTGDFKEKTFVPINCGAIPPSLMESEMFGHKKGAFTGAIQDKKGLFEVASGGTLFLDEIGELLLDLQSKLLRALQEKKIRPVGGIEDISVKVRLIAATNRNLEERVRKKEFREDLFYRLNVLNIEAPSLRERRTDISMLAQHFLEKYCHILKKSISSISHEAMDILKSYDYPGNVRELENSIERAVALERESMIFPESLPPAMLSFSPQSNPEVSSQNIDFKNGKVVNLEDILNQIERSFLIKALEATKGVKKKAAQLLNITFRSIRYRLKKFNLDSEEED